MQLVMEHKTIAATGEIARHLDRESLVGWEHYDTMPGCLDGDGYRPVGVTLFFRKPLDGQEKQPTKTPANRKS